MVKKLCLLLLVFVSIILFVSFVSASNVGLVENSTWQSNLTAVRFSSMAWGDLNGDGKLDLVLIGCLSGAGGQDCNNGVIAKVYINNGTSLVENQTWESNLTGVGYGSLALGDINNDGKLDLSISGCTTGTNWGCDGNVISKVYLSNGTSFVENNQWENNLTGVFDSSMSLGDINNDGKLDLVINGAKYTLPFYTSKIYINNGTSFTESNQWENNLIGVYGGQISLGDINNDGKLDLVLTGDSGSSNKNSKIYINNGTSLLEDANWEQNLAILSESTVLFGDYNNDGKLDLVFTGNAAGDFIYVYNNNGTTLLLNQTRDGPGNLIGVYFASLAFGDYNNDGYLDLAEIGNEAGYARVYYNNQSNNNYFVQDSTAYANISTNLFQGPVTWVDINNDGKLDLVIIGADFALGTNIAKVFINNETITDILPSTPTSGFSSNYSVTNTQLNLSWGNGSDAETNTSGLYYNLMIGNATMNNTIVSGVYGGSSGGSRSGGASNGYFGNMMQRKNITLNLALPAGTYYWYVQTIDTGLAKSAWSAPQNFTVGVDTTKPTITSVTSSSITTSTATITWTTDEMANSTVFYGTTIATTSSSSDTTLTQGHSIGLTGLSASTTYYYNASSCDFSNNCNISTQGTFTTSAEATPPSNPGGTSGGGGTATTPTTNQTISKFDVDFSNVSTGTLEVKQGDVKTFSFNGDVKHSITLLSVTASSITLLITSNPITEQINLGETKQVDINNDGINDLEIKLLSIINGNARFYLTKLAGSDIVAKEEIQKGVLFDIKVSLSNLFNVVRTGREIIAKIEVLNVNNIGQVDVGVDYYITSKEDNQTKLVEGSDTLAVEAVASFVRSLTIPYNLKAGNYWFNVDVRYKGEIMASGKVEFTVIINYEIIIAVGMVILIVAGIFVYLWRINRREKRVEKQVKIMKQKMGNKIVIVKKRKK